MALMETIKRHDTGPAVEEFSSASSPSGCSTPPMSTGAFGDTTAEAVQAFCGNMGLPLSEEVTEKVWAALVDASFTLGDRTLYLRMPHFHGHDVLELQHALAALGFACGAVDGIFGAFTELALRKFQLNLGLPSDGIAGAYTYAAIRNLHHSWDGQGGRARLQPPSGSPALRRAGAQRAVPVRHAGLYAQRRIAHVESRAGHEPASKIMSADSLLVAPDESMLLVHIVLPGELTVTTVPRVSFDDEETLSLRLETAIGVADAASPSRIAVELPGIMWEDAGEGRSAQHFAITLLDALCTALS